MKNIKFRRNPRQKD